MMFVFALVGTSAVKTLSRSLDSLNMSESNWSGLACLRFGLV